MRATKLVSISMAPELFERADRLAREESRTRSELFREALRNYIEQREWARLAAYGRARASEQGLAEGDVERLIDADREERSAS